MSHERHLKSLFAWSASAVNNRCNFCCAFILKRIQMEVDASTLTLYKDGQYENSAKVNQKLSVPAVVRCSANTA